MKGIKLTQGRYTIVDDEDFEWLSKFKWRTEMRHRGNNNDVKGVVRHPKYSDGVYRSLRMHRLIMNLQTGDKRIIDHIDGNPLNNQRANLRICTNSQNLRNRGKQRNNTSGYKGVHLLKGKWSAGIKLFGKKHHIGRFNTKEEAAKAYDKKAIELHGKFACLNFPTERKP